MSSGSGNVTSPAPRPREVRLHDGGNVITSPAPPPVVVLPSYKHDSWTDDVGAAVTVVTTYDRMFTSSEDMSVLSDAERQEGGWFLLLAPRAWRTKIIPEQEGSPVSARGREQLFAEEPPFDLVPVSRLASMRKVEREWITPFGQGALEVRDIFLIDDPNRSAMGASTT
ncbi:unnamed protein product, partial [Amoebophrya sp. A25]|eukprot:GSA25T00008975001.1